MARWSFLLFIPLASIGVHAQDAMLHRGSVSTRTIKNVQGDLHVPVDGVVGTDGRPIVFVVEGPAHKLFRLDASQVPLEELSLKDVMLDGKKWNGVTPLVRGNRMSCLLVTTDKNKKSCEFAIAEVPTDGSPLALKGVRSLVAFDAPYEMDPSVVTPRKTLPDLVLFDDGIAYDEHERIVLSPDGQHRLLNYYTRDTKGNKQFYFAYLDQDLGVLWSGTKELPFPDVQSDVHQVALDNNGNIHVLSYVFACKNEDQAADKLCHQVHLSIIGERGTTVTDLLIDKDFISSARVRPFGNGTVMLAVRYGALTGHPGLLIRFDPMDKKLKPAPLIAQRLSSIHKTKLTPFGEPPTSGKKSSKANTKLPDEIVDLIPAWDGGTLLIEEYHDAGYKVPVGEEFVIRHLAGAMRLTYLNAKDSVAWQQTVDRGLITTAGEPYETMNWTVNDSAIVLLYGNSPDGIGAGVIAPAKGKKQDPQVAERNALHVTVISRQGAIVSSRSVFEPAAGFTSCPMIALSDPGQRTVWLKSYDRDKSHAYTVVDLGVIPR